MIYFAIMIPAVCVLVCQLYQSGIAVTKRIRAILFVFLPGRHADKVSLNSCTGWLCHAGRFRENRTYTFALDSQLSKGDVEVSLLDKEKQPLLKLNPQSPAGQTALDGKSRCYLRWEFRGATGKCALRWQAIP